MSAAMLSARYAIPVLILLVPSPALRASQNPVAPASETVSYFKQIRPIFQANCQGCHQPAKAGGRYVMTDFQKLLEGGISELPAVVAKDPEQSYLLDQILPDDQGSALMPKGQKALSDKERALIEVWIGQGAQDDTPSNARNLVDQDHPPVYQRQPVIAALDVSPDGELLAVGGFHEVLLWNSEGSHLTARLIGLSERIQSLRFSPDGERLAVAGGLPGRMGEIQIWNVPKRVLIHSVPVTYDTLNGVSWSPDGSLIAFGCGDNSVRAIESATGQQALFMGSHSDWALGTVFSKDGSHLISVGRDMAVKLTEVATQRFVDNITSITPGALKGGIQSVARHPQRDEVVIGGADGFPSVYRVFREVQRVIGDDSNLIRKLPGLPGRIFSVAVSPDGKRIAAGSSSDGSGQVSVYSYEFDTKLPENIKAIMAKVSTTRSAEENTALEQYASDGVKLIASKSLPGSGVYALAFRPDGRLVVAGADGVVRIMDSESGEIQIEFGATPISGTVPVAALTDSSPESLVQDDNSAVEVSASDSLPADATLLKLEATPEKIELNGSNSYAQLVITATLQNGDTVDATRLIAKQNSHPLVMLSATGSVRPIADGQGTLRLALAGHELDLDVKVSGVGLEQRSDFIQDVNPVLSRLGCNQGTCHGAAQGKNGFKLSLRGYDPLFDVRALRDDHASRRVNLASPDDSLMLLKATGSVAHGGGQLMKVGEPYYGILRNWITAGAMLDAQSPKVQRIEVFPINPVIQKIGSQQQLRVIATYVDGQVRDVTREAFLDSGNTEVVKAERSSGLMTSLRRGEAPVLARFEGAYASTTLTVMGDRDGFAWQEPESYSEVDKHVARKWERLKIQPSDPCSDAEFIRRATLDLTGLPPTVDEVQAFLADSRETRVKRDELVDKLIGSAPFVEHWTNKWADLLQVNRKFLDVEGATTFRAWIRDQVASNVPYDKFVHSILTASGSTKQNPAASYFKVLRDPAATMENTTQLFLAIRFNCNKCHDHPFEKWNQDQYYETAAYFAQIGLETDPESKGRMVGGTAVEGAKPVYEIVKDTGSGEMIHDRTKKVAQPEFPYECKFEKTEGISRRSLLASWLTSADNPYFARSYVNRLWGYLLGVGLIEPLDDMRAGNPPSNPELLDYLTREFIQSGFNVQHVIRLVCKSRTYQLSVKTNRWNEDDQTNFSHALARRLPAEVLLDAVYQSTGATSAFPGVAPGTRAAALPDSGVELPSGFLTTFGRPARESACECERTSDLQLGPIMALVSGPTIAEAIADPNNAVSRLVAGEADDRKLVGELFLRVLNRPATESEIQACLADFSGVDKDHNDLVEVLVKREKEFALHRPELETQRSAMIAQAQAALRVYETEYMPRRAQQEKERIETITKLEADLKAYEEGSLQTKIQDWEKNQTSQVQWIVLRPTTIKSNRPGTTFEVQPDDSILVSGDDENGVITMEAVTDLKTITGIRLEMIADDKLPVRGPGRSGDGNFVLTEFQATITPESKLNDVKPAVLANPLADFTQQGFDVKQLIDSELNRGNGWALSPATGVTHWATFDLKEAMSLDGSTRLTFSLRHNFGKSFQPGRFRISITSAASPVGLSLAEEYQAILAIPLEARTQTQRDSLTRYRRFLDEEWIRQNGTLVQSRAPLPEDPTLLKLKADVEAARKPVPVDPVLAQLRQDLEQSVSQVASKRLTVAQDIVWALINSPAFLFNH